MLENYDSNEKITRFNIQYSVFNPFTTIGAHMCTREITYCKVVDI